MSKEKRVIGLDFDDILMDFRPSLDSYHNAQYGTNFKPEEATEYALWKPWSCTEEESIQRVLDFYASEHHHEALPVAGVKEALAELRKENSLVVITSRPDSVKERTLAWLHKHFDKTLFDNVFFANLFASKGVKKNKSQICEELGVDIFVDDHLDYAQDVAKSGRKVLLFDKPWNRTEVTHPNITRVHSWGEIMAALNEAA